MTSPPPPSGSTRWTPRCVPPRRGPDTRRDSGPPPRLPASGSKSGSLGLGHGPGGGGSDVAVPLPDRSPSALVMPGGLGRVAARGHVAPAALASSGVVDEQPAAARAGADAGPCQRKSLEQF